MARRRAADNVSMHAWFVTALIVVALAASSCASSGARPQPFPMPPGPENPAADIPDRPPGVDVPLAHPDGFAIASAALRLQGIPYRSGGADPQGFDCSGLVQYVLARYGLSVPRVVRDQYAVGTRYGSTRSNQAIWCSSRPKAGTSRTSASRSVAIASSTHRMRAVRCASTAWRRDTGENASLVRDA